MSELTLEFILVFLVAILPNVYGSIAQLRNPGRHKEVSNRTSLFSSLVYCLAVLSFILFIAFRQPARGRSVGLSVKDVGPLGVVGGGSLLVVVYSLAVALWSFICKLVFNKKPDLSGPHWDGILRYKTFLERFAFLIVLVLGALTEELLYRGYLVLLMSQRTGVLLPWAILSVLLSVAVHLYQGLDPAKIGFHFLFAIATIAATVMTGSVWVAFTGHLLVNLSATIKTWLRGQAPSKPEEADKPFSNVKTQMWARLPFYIRFVWRFILLQLPEPLIYGIAVTDRCNLACRGCHVSNTGRPDMTWDQLRGRMHDAWRRGFRDLYFSGGEPMLWSDGAHTLADAIAEARRIGFYHIHVYTNGTRGLDIPADLAWVSMDGLPGTFEQRRGDHFHEVERAVRQGRHPKVAVIYVIDRHTAAGVEPFLQWVRETRFPVIGVMFYFHTPYYGRDELYLDAAERAPIIDRLLACIRAGLPVINSVAGLRALQSGNWPRRLPVAFVADVDGESACCRAADEICADCGYGACTELTASQRLRPSALLGMMRYW